MFKYGAYIIDAQVKLYCLMPPDALGVIVASIKHSFKSGISYLLREEQRPHLVSAKSTKTCGSVGLPLTSTVLYVTLVTFYTDFTLYHPFSP